MISTEVTSAYLTLDEAVRISDKYKEEGYDDVAIEEIKEIE